MTCARRAWIILLSFLIFVSAIPALSQSGSAVFAPETDGLNPESRNTDLAFRIERVPVKGGAELVTILARKPHDNTTQGPVSDLPLVTVLRDTLGDDKPENDRLRYLWMLTYTEPSLRQKAAGFVPFLYRRTRNKTEIGKEPPPPVIDLVTSDKEMWNKIFWTIFKKIALNEIGVGVRASASQYRQNAADYKRTAIAAALTVLALYQDTTGETVLSESEMKDIQARLYLSDKMFGWHMQSENLGRTYDRESALAKDYRGHNWELLRQYTEAQGLYFDPIEMPDGSARHAIVWASASAILANKGKKFERRFLNLKSPWGDEKLLKWKGYTETRWYDADDREVASETPGAHAKTLIPLAVYGLDHPKVPIILVDFRDNENPKFREISKRILSDLTGNVLSLAQFSGIPFFVGRLIYDFVTGRRGLDVNQTSRLRAYAQLKLLLSLDESLDADFRGDIARRVESATLNPLQNDADIELQMARTQYDNLLAWAARDDGLPAVIDKDRREEMVRINHGTHDRTWFGIGHLLSFGLYTHREKATPELVAQMDLRRQLDYHERFLREVALVSAEPRIDTDVDALRKSLQFLSAHGEEAGEKTTRALAKIFAISKDTELRDLSLASLYRINNSGAKKQLLAMYKNDKIDERWRNACAKYLRLALQEGQRISKRDAIEISAMASN